jgi:hypothetical protein
VRESECRGWRFRRPGTPVEVAFAVVVDIFAAPDPEPDPVPDDDDDDEDESITGFIVTDVFTRCFFVTVLSSIRHESIDTL